MSSTRSGPGGHKTGSRSHKALLLGIATFAALAVAAPVHAAPLNSAAEDTPTQGLLRSAHPLSRRSVDAPLAGEAPLRQRDRDQAHDKRQSARQGIVAVSPASDADDQADTVASAVSAVVSTPAAATVVRAVTSAGSTSASPSSSSAATTSPSSSSSSSQSSTASATPSSAHTGFTLTDTENKLYPLWIVVLIAGIFAGLFVILCGARWCIFRPHGKQDPDAYLTGGAAGRGRSIRAGAKSLRKALTKRKLAGSSFARRKQEGSVLLEVGDEVFAVPPSVAEEYQAAKKMFGGGSASGSSNGHGSTPGVSTTGNPFSWNGKAYLAQCLTRYEADKKRAAAGGARSATAQMNIDAWTRSTSTLVTDADEKAGGRNQAYGAKRFDGDDGDDSRDDAKPKRGLSGRLAAGFRAAMRGNRDDEDDELGDPEKTTDLSTFLPVVTRQGDAGSSNKNGWSITPRVDDAEQRGLKVNRRISSSTPRAAPTPITKDTPRMHGTEHSVPRKAVQQQSGLSTAAPPRPSPAVLQKSAAQQTRMQPRGVALEDDQPGRDRIVTRRFPHDPVLLNGPNGQQRTGTVKKVRVNSTAEAIGTPIWEQNARSKPQSNSDRVVSMPSFQPGQMIAHGTVPQQQPGGLAPGPPQAGRDRLRETRAASASQGPKRSTTTTAQQQQQPSEQRRHASQRSNTMRVSPQHQARRGGGEEVRLDRGRA